MRSVQPRVLAASAFLSLTVTFACSSSSGDKSSETGAASGNAGSSSSANAQAGTGSSGGSAAQAGSSAQAGNSSAGTAAGGASGGSAGSAAQAGSAGANGDGCANALLCDDFEKYTSGVPPTAPWTNNASGGVVTVDATHAHSGTQAVKFAAASASGYRSAMINLQNTMLLPTTGNVVYGRMMFWLDSAPTTSVHWTFIDGQGKVPGQNYHSVYRYGGQLPITNGADFVGNQLMANYDTPDSYATPTVGPSSDCWQHADMVVVPVGAWACAEWKFDGAANKMQFWLDGNEVTSLAMNGTGQGCVHEDATFAWSAPSFERIDLGFESYQADDARNLWIDDVAIGTQKMGCPQ